MNRFLDTLAGKTVDRPPFWYMRQAGRYLPEYRQIREGAGDFLALCYNPPLASEVTIQPIRRFGMDAAIIFSDILVVPHALGRAVRFEKGEGPRLEPLVETNEIAVMDVGALPAFLAPVYEALERTRAALPGETALIGFAGAPWTLACYLIDGRGKTGFIETRKRLHRDPAFLAAVTDKLVEAVSEHLVRQVEAGANALQLFDSWAGLCPASRQAEMIVAPAREIVSRVRARCPGVPIICFPRGLGAGLADYAREVKPDGLGIDTETDLTRLDGIDCVLQGNLDPLLLASDRDGTLTEARRLLSAMKGRKYIFNLGHGVVPETPPETVQALSDLLREAA